MEGQLEGAMNFVAQLYEVDQAIAGAENSKKFYGFWHFCMPIVFDVLLTRN